MVAITDFQSCCTASIIYGFGEEGAADGAARRAFQENNTKEKMKASIVNRIKGKKAEGDGLITAILTDNQVMGAELLTELGFTSSGWYRKERHSENQIAIFYLGLKEWVEPVVQVQAPVHNPFAAPVAPPVRPFHITYMKRNGRPGKMGVINQKLRCAGTNAIQVVTFNSMAHFAEVMGYTFEQARELRRDRGLSDLTVVYN